MDDDIENSGEVLKILLEDIALIDSKNTLNKKKYPEVLRDQKTV